MELVSQNDKRNYLKPDRAYISKVWFDYADDFKEGFGIVELNNKWNFIKSDGTYLSDIWFDYAKYFHNDVVNVKIKNEWYELDYKGNIKFCGYVK